MKGFLLVVLAVLAVSNAAEVQGEADRSVVFYEPDAEPEQVANPEPVAPLSSNLSIGYVGMYYRLLYREWFLAPAIPNEVQSQDVVYQGRENNQIWAIRAEEEGATQFGSASLVAGGLYGNTATVRLSSARGGGYYYRVSIWGR